MTPNLDEVRLLVDIEVIDEPSSVKLLVRSLRWAYSGRWSRAVI